MTEPSARSARRGGGPGSLALAVCVLGGGCASTLPLQTASTVPHGAYRVSGDITHPTMCSFLVGECADVPGSPVTPELRVAARYGAFGRQDVGLSAAAAASLGGGSHVSMLVDTKREVWRSTGSTLPGYLVSVGLGAGYREWAYDAGGRDGAVSFAVPVYFGRQFDSLELTFGVRVIEELHFLDRGATSRRELSPWTVYGLSIGLFGRARAAPAFELSYQAPVALAASGTFLLSAGVLFDLVPSSTDDD